MKDIVIVKSKTINHESVPVIIDIIKPGTGEDEEREITRSVIFENFQAEVSLKIAKKLVEMNENEFSIVKAKGEVSKRAKGVIKTAQEKAIGFVCVTCGKKTKNKAGLTAHIRYAHPELLNK